MNILQYILPTHPHTTHRHRYLLPRDHSLDWLLWVRRNAIKVRGKKHINSMPWYYVTYTPPTLWCPSTVWQFDMAGSKSIRQTWPCFHLKAFPLQCIALLSYIISSTINSRTELCRNAIVALLCIAMLALLEIRNIKIYQNITFAMKQDKNNVILIWARRGRRNLF